MFIFNLIRSLFSISAPSPSIESRPVDSLMNDVTEHQQWDYETGECLSDENGSYFRGE
jgi:hypothetical protein